jgi:hypothetical protein
MEIMSVTKTPFFYCLFVACFMSFLGSATIFSMEYGDIPEDSELRVTHAYLNDHDSAESSYLINKDDFASGDVVEIKKNKKHTTFALLPAELQSGIVSYVEKDFGVIQCLFASKSFSVECKNTFQEKMNFSMRHALWIIERRKNCKTRKEIAQLRKDAMKGNWGNNYWNDMAVVGLWDTGLRMQRDNEKESKFKIYKINTGMQANKLYVAILAMNEGQDEIKYSEEDAKNLVNGYLQTRVDFLQGVYKIEKKLSLAVNDCINCGQALGACYLPARFMCAACVFCSIGTILNVPILSYVSLATAGVGFVTFFGAGVLPYKCGEPCVPHFGLFEPLEKKICKGICADDFKKRAQKKLNKKKHKK